MIPFLNEIGMQVELCYDQLCPLFNRARAVRVKRGDVCFNLEKSSDGNPAMPFNLFLSGYGPEDFERLDCLGYAERSERTFYGISYVFTSQDGGKILIT